MKKSIIRTIRVTEELNSDINRNLGSIKFNKLVNNLLKKWVKLTQKEVK